MRWGLTLGFLMLVSGIAIADGKLLLNATFDDADLTGWRTAGDLCVAPSFCAGEPSGHYWVAFSTNDAPSDSITMCGGSAVQGMQSVLRTPDLPLPFKPSRIKIDFKVKFLTNENTGTDLGTDDFLVRLLTMAGPVAIASIDDSGASPDSKNLKIKGDTTLHESSCNPNWKYETGLLQVSYYRTFREPVTSKMATGPIALEFSLNNGFDQNFDSAVVLDDVQIRVYQ